MEGILRRTRGPHVHVEHDEMTREHVGDGQVAQAVQRIDLLRNALQLPSRTVEHAVGAAHVHNIQREAEARGEGALGDEGLHLRLLLLVDEDGDAHGATREGREKRRPAPAPQQVGEVEEALGSGGERRKEGGRGLRDHGDVEGRGKGGLVLRR